MERANIVCFSHRSLVVLVFSLFTYLSILFGNLFVSLIFHLVVSYLLIRFEVVSRHYSIGGAPAGCFHTFPVSDITTKLSFFWFHFILFHLSLLLSLPFLPCLPNN